MKKEEPILILFHESVFQSWLKDIWTFGRFGIVIAINYFLFDNNGVATFFLILFWFIWQGMKAKGGKRFYDKESAIEYINEV